MLVSIGISLLKSGAVTIFFLFVIPVNVMLIYTFRKKMRMTNNVYRKESENVSARVTNMLEMIPVTKAHGLENVEISDIDKNIKALTQKGLELDNTNAYFGAISWVLSRILSGLCLLFTGYLAVKGKISVGNIVLYQTYFNLISGDILTLVSIYPEITKGMESLRSINEVMTSDDIEDNKGKKSLEKLRGNIKFDNVTYRYPGTDKDVIKDFSLNVKEGECIALVGASGCGKTTLINMIIGLLKATEGTVSIDGNLIDTLNLSDYRHYISVVPQNSILFTGSIRDNITYGLKCVSEEKLNEVIEMANINEFVGELSNGIDTVIGERGDKLSGGQKQRISIARALIRNPRILILDEATSALDNISEFHVQKAITKLIKGRTAFIVAHRLSTIRYADRIIVLDNGRCVEQGTYDELLEKKGLFYELKTLNDMGKSIDEAIEMVK